MSGFFYNLGRHVGRKAVPAMRKSKLIWDGLTGSEEELFRAEVSLGQTLAAELRSVSEPANDPAVQKLAGELCRRLTACVKDNRRPFQCEVIRENIPNGIALPGGFIFISHTLVQLCERQPDELAFAIAHEMGHVVRGHAWDRMINEAALSVVTTLAQRAGAVGAWLRQQGFTFLRSAHDHNCELEADELGLRLVKAAGFSSGGAIVLMQRVEALRVPPSRMGLYFETHPQPLERIAHLKLLEQKIAVGE
jgi:predicted Zn-dependent protease